MVLKKKGHRKDTKIVTIIVKKLFPLYSFNISTVCLILSFCFTKVLFSTNTKNNSVALNGYISVSNADYRLIANTALNNYIAPLAPTVIITEDTNDDGFIDPSELSGDIHVSTFLPATGVNVGDLLAITNGVIIQSVFLSAGDIAAGFFVVSFPNPGDGNTVNISANITDGMGDTSPNGMDSAIIDLTAPSAPTVSISEDVNDDGLINSVELSGVIDVTITLPGGLNPGDEITAIDGNGNTVMTVLIAGDISSGSVNINFPDPGHGNNINVSALITDNAGNIGPSSPIDNATLDLVAPAAPTVAITEDVDDNGFINSNELSGAIDVIVTLPGGLVPGDGLTAIDGNGNTVPMVLNAGDIAGGTVSISFPNPGDGNSINVSATASDIAGNISPSSIVDSATMDLIAPLIPTVTITEDLNDDGFINIVELSGNIDIAIGLPGGLNPGDEVTVIDGNGNTAPVILSAGDISGGSVNVNFPNPGNGNNLNVSATITDTAGNTGPSSIVDIVTIDLTAPLAPTVTITEDVDDNGFINSNELSGTIDVAVTFPSGLNPNDEVTVIDGNGNTEQVTLSVGDISSGSININFPNPGDGNSINASSTITDTAGNTGPGSIVDTATMDLIAPSAPTVTITEDIDDNGIINVGELSGAIDVTVTLPGGLNPGDGLIVIDGNGNMASVALSAGDISSGSVIVNFPDPGDGNSINVSATITDVAGNTSAGSIVDSAVMDLIVPLEPIVTITEDIDNNSFINSSELSGAIDVMITLPGGLNPGDEVTIIDGNGNTVPVILSAGDISSGSINVSFPNPGDGNTVDVSATISDTSGNTSPSSTVDSATIDLIAPLAPTVTIIEDLNDDDFINSSELIGAIDITITLPVGLNPGDKITTIDGNGNTVLATLSASDISDGSVNVSFPSPGDGNNVNVSATIADIAGNSGPSSVVNNAVMDLTIPSAPTVIIIEDLNDDGFINTNELSGTIDVVITLSGGLDSGDELTAIDGNGNTIQMILSAGDISSGSINIDFPNPGDGNNLDVSSSITDTANNIGPSSVTDSAMLDLTAPLTSTVTIIEDLDNDGFIHPDELFGAIDVTITLPGGLNLGDVLTVIDGNGNTEQVTLSADDISSGNVNVSFAGPGDGNSIDASATITDVAGNIGPSSAVDSVILELTDTDKDGIIDSQEILDNTDPLDDCDSIGGTPLSTSDCDNDGLSNGEETVHGTDSLNPDTDNDGVFDGQEVSDNTNPLDDCNSIGGTALSTSDCDNDGLSNSEETILGTEPLNADTDDDEISDGQEVIDNTNPLDSCDSLGGTPTPTGDCDNDGLTNGQEAILGTDPLNFDTDEDGISDNQETIDGTDPLDPCNSVGGSAPSHIECNQEIKESGTSVSNEIVTPDGDGVNDFFRIENIESFPNNTVQIYNRWGGMVYETIGYDNSNNVFRGESNAKATIQKDANLPVGVYFFVIKYVNDNEHFTKSGNLYINR